MKEEIKQLQEKTREEFDVEFVVEEDGYYKDSSNAKPYKIKEFIDTLIEQTYKQGYLAREYEVRKQVCWRCYMSKEDAKRYGDECRDGYANHLWEIRGEKLYRNNKQ